MAAGFLGKLTNRSPPDLVDARNGFLWLSLVFFFWGGRTVHPAQGFRRHCVPKKLFAVLHCAHWVLVTLSIITVLGAVIESH
jgi:hypothetical protein